MQAPRIVQISPKRFDLNDMSVHLRELADQIDQGESVTGVFTVHTLTGGNVAIHKEAWDGFGELFKLIGAITVAQWTLRDEIYQAPEGGE